MLDIKKTVSDGRTELILEGRLDAVTAPELDAAWKGAQDGTTELILDCAGLEYISSAGLRVFLSAQKTMSKRGSMKVIHVNDMVMEIFEVTGFTDILTIE